MIDPEDRAKAAFLADYREICEKHQMLILLVESDHGAVFTTAELSDWALDQAIQEMHLESMRLISRK